MTQYAGVVPIEIQCGREGLWGIRNKNMIPIGGAIELRNATLEDHTWRSGGGAQKLGVQVPSGNVLLNAGIDYWPTPLLQRNVVSGGDGTINKDDGTGNAWVALVSGLSTASPYNPFFVLGGAEAAGRHRKCFYCDGVNDVRVLNGDAGADAPIADPGVALTAAVAAGTALGIGVYKYAYSWVTANGETLPSPLQTATTTGGNQNVNLSVIAAGPAGTTARKVYRTKVNSTQLLLLTTINDNVTTTFADITPDSQLGLTTPSVPVTNNSTATTHKIERPPADWSGTNQPSGLVGHQGYNWGFGNPNAPHTLYRSLQSDHEDFLSTPYSLNLFPGEGQYIACALSFKGGMLVWKYPTGAYFIDTTDPNPLNWQQKRIGNAGSAGPACAVLLENDAIWVAPDASFHLASATYATGSVHASDIAYRKLGQFPRLSLNVSRIAFGKLCYYTQKREVQFACAPPGGTLITRRLVLDLNREQDQGERWHFWDRDDNECIYLRRGSDSTPRLVMGDNLGQIWILDQANRDKAGSAYTFEFFMADTDFSQFVPQWAGKWKNLRYVQIEWDPHTQATLTLEVYRDGKLSQSIAVRVTAGGLVFPFTLPALFGQDTLQVSEKRQILGRARRMALRGYVTQTDADVSISRLIVGVEVGE